MLLHALAAAVSAACFAIEVARGARGPMVVVWGALAVFWAALATARIRRRRRAGPAECA